MVTLATNALCTLADIKDTLGVAVSITAYDDRLKRLINACSEWIETYCNRSFRGYGSISGERHTADQGDSFYLANPPIDISKAIVISFDGAATSWAYGVDYIVIDSAILRLLSQSKIGSGLAHGLIAPSMVPYSGTERYTLAYWGGYVLPSLAAWIALTGYTLGDLCSNGGHIYQCITTGTSAASGGPTTTGVDITDGSVHWLYCGDNVRTLPYAIEQACIDLVKWRYNRDAGIASESLGNYSISYSNPNTAIGIGIIPGSITITLDPYTRPRP